MHESWGERMKLGVDQLVSAVLGVAALGVAVSVVHREFGRPRSPAAQEMAAGPPTFVPQWRKLVRAGREVGDSTSDVNVIEFADFECPYCRAFDATMRDVERHYAGRISRVFLNYPIQGHRFARPAARAADCAGRQGRFARMHDILYTKQDSLGLKPWTSYAREADVADTSAFVRCVAESAALMSVDADVALAAALGVNATPTVIVNGWRFARPPSDSELIAIIDALKAGRDPTGAKVTGSR